MGAPSHLHWQFEQRRARLRLRRWQRIEAAGWHVAIFCGGVGLGVAVVMVLR